MNNDSFNSYSEHKDQLSTIDESNFHFWTIIAFSIQLDMSNLYIVNKEVFLLDSAPRILANCQLSLLSNEKQEFDVRTWNVGIQMF